MSMITSEDIELLGWTKVGTNAMRDIIYYKGKEEWFGRSLPLSPMYKFWEYKLSHDIKYGGIKIECRTSNGDEDVFFEGLVSTKEDLIKIMTQIGILDGDE